MVKQRRINVGFCKKEREEFGTVFCSVVPKALGEQTK